MSEIISAYSFKLINSLLLTLVFLGGYLLCRFLLTRKVKVKKIRSQYIIRCKYLFVIIFMIFFIKVWVEGFLQILAFVGFLSAAITLTQKENLMNIVGWLIINWRGLFSEEDYIRISNFSGTVRSIGFLYFTLIENNPDFPDSATGRIIKIPNGMVSRNPITNFSQEKYTECTMSFVFKPKGDFTMIETLYAVLEESVRQYWQSLQQTIHQEPHGSRYLIRMRQDKPAGYEMLFLFYCKPHDKLSLQYQLNKMVLDFTGTHPELTLAFD